MDNEREYLRVLAKVVSLGDPRPDRTGTGTLSLFGEQMRFDISESVPALTTKFVPWKSCVKELLWFCRGDTDAKILSAQGVKIWDGNTSREFLDARGLHDLPEGSIGAGYSWQWRYAGAKYSPESRPTDGYDQLSEMLRLLREDKYSRRIFMTAWAPGQLDQMALPACHVSCQFYVNSQDELSCHMYQRSCDMFLGVPWNILSYSILTYVLADKAGLKPKELIVSCGDTHVYKDHLEQAKDQLMRDQYAGPKLTLSDAVKDKAWEDLTVDDFELVDYKYHPAIKARMSI